MLSDISKDYIESAHIAISFAIMRAKLDKCDPDAVANLERLYNEIGELY